MTEAITAFYLATVWMSSNDYDADRTSPDWATTRQVIRLPAIGPEDFKARVRGNWPNKVVAFGPVSLSKVQG